MKGVSQFDEFAVECFKYKFSQDDEFAVDMILV